MLNQLSRFIVFFVCNFVFHLGFIKAQSFQLFINEFMAANKQTIADETGEFDDWIEIYNGGNDPINISGLYLTDNLDDPSKWSFPDTSISPKGFLITWADGDTGQGRLHTNFKLSATGEQIAIFDGNNFIDSLTFGEQKTDVSYGRYNDASSNWFFFTAPTPGTSNKPPSLQFLESPVFSPPGGFYQDSVAVHIQVTSPTVKIYYTLDCSDPTENSPIYTQPIKMSTTTVLRAQARETGFYPSDIITQIYIIDKDFDIATLSLVTDPVNLWDENYGIYMNPNNSGDAWERPVAVEFYDPLDQLCFAVNAGIRIGGEVSREYEKKSFRLYLRSEYGPGSLEYQLFRAKKSVDRFKRLSVHSGSTDMPANPFGFGWTLLRDPLMYELGKRVGCIFIANQPVAIFLNGEPWGIYNFMERVDKYFVESNFNELDVDLIENNNGARDGDMMEWNKLIDFFESYDFSHESSYETAKTKIDIQNFTNYQILEIYGGNGDWPHHNVFSYRLRTEDAIWRWILWDMDGCFGPYGVSHNTLDFATRDDPSTLILRKLLENQNYKNLFINRFADLLNSVFAYTSVNYLIDSLADVIRSDIAFETTKWGSSAQSWEEDGVDGEFRDFAQNRPDVVRYHIRNQFNIDGKITLTTEPHQAGKGKIRVNSITIDRFPWSGIYFKNIPIELEAIPGQKYRFKQWRDPMLPQDSKISLILTEDFVIAAEFEFDPTRVFPIINEINYNSAVEFDPSDWIELYNPSDDTVDLTSWYFKDDDDSHVFLFPGSTKIDPNSYIVLCQNRIDFHSLFPEVTNYIGDFNFGLDANGDMVRIYNANSILIDSVKYDDSPPWQTAPDGHGPTLELIDPELDNHLAENWHASIGHGTPGKQNSAPGSFIYPEQELSELQLNNSLFQNYPNPFNSITQIKYDLITPAFVQIIVYNLLGEKIQIIMGQYQMAGSHVAYWEGKDYQGRSVPSGIYLYQINTGTFKQMRKMVMLR